MSDAADNPIAVFRPGVSPPWIVPARHAPHAVHARHQPVPVTPCAPPCDPGEPIRFSTHLERVNQEHRAAIESERLLTQLMAWQDATRSPLGSSHAAPHVPQPQCTPCAPSRTGAPKIGEVSPVTDPIVRRQVTIVDRVRALVGRVTDIFA